MTTPNDLLVAKTIIEQLGGNTFTRMTGAKNFVGSKVAVSFQLPGGGGFCKQGINGVRIELASNDTYTVTFYRRRGNNVKTISEHTDIYAENLRDVFKSETGLETAMPRVQMR